MSQHPDSTGSAEPTSSSRSTAPDALAPHGDPFRAVGIIGFVLSFFAILNFAGLIISVIALIRSKRAGFRNRFAFAGIVISSIGVVITVVVVSFAVTLLVGAAQTCARLGEGVHTVDGATYTCTPTSFEVTYGSPASAPSVDDDEWSTVNELYAEAI